MRREFTDKAIAIPAGPKIRGAAARSRALIFINLILLVTFVSTSLFALKFSTSGYEPVYTISYAGFEGLQAISDYKVNPAMPGWK
ncbi:MAG: hypothetical protein AAGA53_11235 [Pseudomonadota bacterium]